MSIALAWVVGLILSQAVPQEALEARRIAAMLRPGNPREAAWGAYTAARDSVRDQTPELIRYLEEWQGEAAALADPVTPEDAAVQAVADALIQLGAEVPAEAAAKLYPKFPAQALILLSRAKGADQVLLRIFATTKVPIVLLAAGNLLARSPPVAFAVELMAGFREELIVAVVEPGCVPNMGGFGPGTCSWIMKQPPEFKDWPRMRGYGLETMRNGGRVLFAPGLNPVGYFGGSRRTTAPTVSSPSRPDLDTNTPSTRITASA